MFQRNPRSRMEKRIGESEYQDLLNRQTRDRRAEVRGRGKIQVSGIGREERERLWAVGINMHVSAGPWFMCACDRYISI